MDIQLRLPVIGGSSQQQLQEAAMSNRAYTFSANNSYSIPWWFSLLARYSHHQEHPAAHIPYGGITPATSYSKCVCLSFGAIRIYRSSNAAVIKQH
ncbi:predicted protein [Lichtheimia corymbifera JMRC:FSU:9682]|uniref:Uncharacterized protein n=1 Tax=Lichtheimia corymbifera JMRC:FSU:9682 TaxID=1263082 RepID=A0A068S390_9FUNG|nr:predicted protein [Lichtheimia corymbifera JMRC:FSU:9682]